MGIGLAGVLIVAIWLISHIGGGNHDTAPSVEYPASVYSLSAGDCVNNLPYESLLNTPTLTKSSCSDSTVRMKFIGQYMADSIATMCTESYEGWQIRGAVGYCFEYAAREGTCYLAWVRPNDYYFAYLGRPHDCREDVRSGIDFNSSKPQDALYMTVIRIDDVVGSRSRFRCSDGLEYDNLTDFRGTVRICARCLTAGCPAV